MFLITVREVLTGVGAGKYAGGIVGGVGVGTGGILGEGPAAPAACGREIMFATTITRNIA